MADEKKNNDLKPENNMVDEKKRKRYKIEMPKPEKMMKYIMIGVDIHGGKVYKEVTHNIDVYEAQKAKGNVKADCKPVEISRKEYERSLGYGK